MIPRPDIHKLPGCLQRTNISKANKGPFNIILCFEPGSQSFSFKSPEVKMLLFLHSFKLKKHKIVVIVIGNELLLTHLIRKNIRKSYIYVAFLL